MTQPSDHPDAREPPFEEHRIKGPRGDVYARDYPGGGPAFVLMHGFPDNLHIYDDLVPHLVASGRRVVTFDFLSFGQSEKPAGATYSFSSNSVTLKRSSTSSGWSGSCPSRTTPPGPRL